MRKIRLVFTVALAAGCLAVLAVATAHAAPRIETAPAADYAMSNPCGGALYCTETVTIDSNPSNYQVRAWMNCTDGLTHFGGWHSSGTTTAGCGTGGATGTVAGFEYDKTHLYSVTCWIDSGPRTGSC